VESSSTDVSRLRGARPISDIALCYSITSFARASRVGDGVSEL
jgi:hypothetical protein